MDTSDIRSSEGGEVKLTSIAANQTELEYSDGVTILYSYSTPVAAFVPGVGACCTTKHYSATTSRHINAAVTRWGASRHNVEQVEINLLAERRAAA